jgi:mannose-6-phosphate isomerase-like protein (cupin superfamily)
MKIHLRSKDLPDVVGSGGKGHSLTHVISPATVGSQMLWVGETVLQPGVKTMPSALADQESAHVTLEGLGTEIVEGEVFYTEPGSFVFLAKGALHQVSNRGETPLKLITIATPPFGLSSKK